MKTILKYDFFISKMVKLQQLFVVVVVIAIHVMLVTINGLYGYSLRTQSDYNVTNSTSYEEAKLYNITKSYGSNMYAGVTGIFIPSIVSFGFAIIFWFSIIACGSEEHIVIYLHLFIHGIFAIAIASTQLTLLRASYDLQNENYDIYSTFSSRLMDYAAFQYWQIPVNYTIGSILMIMPFILPWIKCKISYGVFMVGPVAFPFMKVGLSCD